MRIWHLLVGASIVGAGAVGVACSSSSSGGGTPSEAGTEGGEDGGQDAACIQPDASVATVDAGNAIWSCLESKCAPELLACGCDPICNMAIGKALMDSANDAGAATALLTNAVMMNLSDPPVLPLGTCLGMYSNKCGGPTIDAGLDGGGEAGGSEAGSEGGGSEAGGNEGGSSEGGSDGGAG